MEDTTAKQLVVRPGGSINRNRLTENVQLFGEDGAPFEFEGGSGGGGVVKTIIAGDNVSVDAADPANPIISAQGGGSGSIEPIELLMVDPEEPLLLSGSPRKVGLFWGGEGNGDRIVSLPQEHTEADEGKSWVLQNFQGDGEITLRMQTGPEPEEFEDYLIPRSHTVSATIISGELFGIPGVYIPLMTGFGTIQPRQYEDNYWSPIGWRPIHRIDRRTPWEIFTVNNSSVGDTSWIPHRVAVSITDPDPHIFLPSPPTEPSESNLGYDWEIYNTHTGSELSINHGEFVVPTNSILNISLVDVGSGYQYISSGLRPGSTNGGGSGDSYTKDGWRQAVPEPPNDSGTYTLQSIGSVMSWVLIEEEEEEEEP